MSRADLEAAAEEKYPLPRPGWPGFSRLVDSALDSRAAYIQGRLDQAEADAQIADGRMHPDSRECVICDIAAEIRKGVE